VIFHDVKFKFVYNYLDGLVIYSENVDQHLEHVSQVLSRLRDAGLTVKLSKVALAVQEISFLGHRVSPLDVSIDPGSYTAYSRLFFRRKTHKGSLHFWGW
jgi:hypothetical protein